AAAVLIGAAAGGGKAPLVTEVTGPVPDPALGPAGGLVGGSAGGPPPASASGPAPAVVPSPGAWRGVAVPSPGRAPGGGGARTRGGEPEMSRARLFERLLALFEAVAEQRRLVLVIEDAHWADRSTCDLLSFRVRNLRDASALFIVTFRSDDLDGALLLPLL